MLKKIFSLIGLLCLGVLVSCQGSAAASNSTGSAGSEPEIEAGLSMNTEEGEDDSEGQITLNPNFSFNNSELDLMQLAPPEPGDTLVILHTNMGDITLRMFPEEAPMAYKNFVTHARNGYYDGVIFHRVMENFMIQGGDPEGTGRGGESIWGHGFEAEFSMHLRHIRGALAMAHAGPGTLGSQFYIVHSTDARRFAGPELLGLFDYALENQDEFFDEDLDGNRIYIRDLLSTDMIEAYFRYGGTPHLDLVFNPGGHTVFGHVVAGMDIVDAIAAVEVDVEDRPIEDVVIERVTVMEY